MKKIILALINKAGYRIEKKMAVRPQNQFDLSRVETLRQRGAQIGENVHILDHCIIDPEHCFHIKIGNNVTFAPNVHVLAHDASTKIFLDYTKIKNTYIGNNVFIGAGSIILPGVHIGNNVVVAAGSVVNNNIENDTLVAGNPAKPIMKTSEYIDKMKSLMVESNVLDATFVGGDLNEEMKGKRVYLAAQHNILFIP
jgi:maltose O-acetyltransferase